MPLDGITTFFLANDLNIEYSGARLEKISQPDRFTVELKLRNKESSYLVICVNPSGPYLTVSASSSENPFIPPRFCSVLRKHLSGGRLISIESSGFERAVRFEFRSSNEMGDPVKFFLISEIMGKHSNIILVNENNVIVDSILHIDSATSRLREVLPAHPYYPPPVQSKISPAEAIDAVRTGNFWNESSDRYPAKIIVERITGLSPAIANEIVFRSGIGSEYRYLSLDKKSADDLDRSLTEVLYGIINSKTQPTVVFADKELNTPKDYSALHISSVPFRKTFPSVLAAVIHFYTLQHKIEKIEKKRNTLIKSIAKKINSIENLINVHSNEINDSSDYDKYRIYGDMIYANLYKLKGGESGFETNEIPNSDKGSIYIPLDTDLSPSQNAQKYYKSFKKSKARYENASKFLKNEKDTLTYLESVLIAILNASDNDDFAAIENEFESVPVLKDLMKTDSLTAGKHRSRKAVQTNKKPDTHPRRYISTDGTEILIGRNNIQNDTLTFKTADKDDIWMHLRLSPGTHTIIRSGLDDVTKKTLEEAAMLTAWFSRKEAGRESKATVDYCSVKYVTKQKQSNPGHVFYRNFKSVTVYPGIPSEVEII